MSEQNGQKGILIRGVGGLYGVRPLPLVPGGSVCLCRARGVFRHENITPLPGDAVLFSRDSDVPAAEDNRDAEYVIDEILPRKNSLIRPPLANLTHLFLVIPAARPMPDLVTADKLISIAEADGIEPVILVSKRDLDPARADEILGIYRKAGFDAFSVSVQQPDSIDELRQYITSLSASTEAMTAAFAGASGAGKSTMMSHLFPGLSLKTGDVSRKIQRGRQTTRHVELYEFETEQQVCLIADTPGFSLLDFTRFNFFDPAELPETFREFRPHLGNCRYTKCTHLKEEGCAILEAVARGEIAPGRQESYCAMYADFKKKPDWQRRREERSPGRG